MKKALVEPGIHITSTVTSGAVAQCVNRDHKAILESYGCFEQFDAALEKVGARISSTSMKRESLTVKLAGDSLAQLQFYPKYFLDSIDQRSCLAPIDNCWAGSFFFSIKADREERSERAISPHSKFIQVDIIITWDFRVKREEMFLLTPLIVWRISQTT